MMYLEVSIRQCGKTTRLIQSVLKAAAENPDKRIIVTVPHSEDRNRAMEFENRIGKMNNDAIPLNVFVGYNMATSKISINFVDDANFVKPSDLHIDDDAYYVVCLEDNSEYELNVFIKELLVYYYTKQHEEYSIIKEINHVGEGTLSPMRVITLRSMSPLRDIVITEAGRKVTVNTVELEEK